MKIKDVCVWVCISNFYYISNFSCNIFVSPFIGCFSNSMHIVYLIHKCFRVSRIKYELDSCLFVFLIFSFSCRTLIRHALSLQYQSSRHLFTLSLNQPVLFSNLRFQCPLKICILSSRHLFSSLTFGVDILFSLDLFLHSTFH